MKDFRKIIVAIDPGLSGAIALLHGGKYKGVWSMPTEAAKKGKRINCDELFFVAEHIRTLRKQLQKSCPLLVVLELVGSMPKQGIASAFKFGDCFGTARYFAHSLGHDEIEYVAPSLWKGDMKLTDNKEYSLTRARQLFPAAAECLRRSKDEGRAEALLLARWFYERSLGL